MEESQLPFYDSFFDNDAAKIDWNIGSPLGRDMEDKEGKAFIRKTLHKTPGGSLFKAVAIEVFLEAFVKVVEEFISR